MNTTMVASLVRYLIAACGGALGISAEGNAEAYEQAAGAVMVLISIVWSLYPKWKASRANADGPGIGPALQVAIGCLLPLPWIVGCATTQQNKLLSPDRVEILAKLVVYTGASADIAKNPQHLPDYKLAQEKLTVLMQSPQWDIVTMLAVLKSLPYDELQTPEASIIFSGSVMLIDLVGAGSFDAAKNEHIVAFLCGANKGLSLAINTSGRNLILLQMKAEERATRSTK